MLIGDVGQGAGKRSTTSRAARGGRNYGWRNREGAHDNVTSPPARVSAAHRSDLRIRPQRRRVDHRRIRLSRHALGAAFRGRYFFADYSGRVWSLALTIDGSARRGVRSARAHGGARRLAVLGLSSFGVDADGELYVVNHSAGKITTSPRLSWPHPLRRV